MVNGREIWHWAISDYVYECSIKRIKGGLLHARGSPGMSSTGTPGLEYFKARATGLINVKNIWLRYSNNKDSPCIGWNKKTKQRTTQRFWHAATRPKVVIVDVEKKCMLSSRHAPHFYFIKIRSFASCLCLWLVSSPRRENQSLFARNRPAERPPPVIS